MRTLYLRIYLTVVAVLLLFALVAAFLVQRDIDSARTEGQLLWAERLVEWAELAQGHLPPASAPADEQREALETLAERMHLPLALDAANGERIAASERFERRAADAREGHGRSARIASLPLADGRTLRVLRPGMRHFMGGPGGPGGPAGPGGPGSRFGPPPGLPGWLGIPGAGLVVTLAVLFIAISIGAYPVVRRLTRRLESLKLGVEAFGAGALDRRVAEDGNDEVAAVGASFNRAASRIEALVRSHRSLLANASHELRSPLARMKMALAMVDDAPAAQRAALRREIDTNIAELDALVEEVLLASRLDAAQPLEPKERIDLLALAVEAASHFDAEVQGDAIAVQGDERLLRRALRNLLENARRYGGGEVALFTSARNGRALLRVCDRGAGVPEASRERIFEPFYRLPGHAELAGGVGLGLSLVKQIAERHGGSVRCEAREGGGSCFALDLPLA
jgi:signal transduction histidine kinase